MHAVTAVADVRSHPHSRFNPQFDRQALRTALSQHAIHYVFLGEQLGARRKETQCYVNGKVGYELIAKTPSFAEGLARLRLGIKSHRIALMCAEKDPLTCHRTVLICRHLLEDPIEILHILEDGSLETMTRAEERLLEITGLPQEDLFRCRNELIREAYKIQAERIAYVESETADKEALR